MKWTVAGLIIVGLIAAAAAAVLAVTLKADVGRNALLENAPDEVEIMVAARDIPDMSIVNSDAVAKQMVKRSEMPPQAFTSSAQIIGRPVITPVVKGQPFTAAQFASSESGVKVSQIIPSGSRAMSVMLSDESGIEDLLYPGSIVDVVASFRLPAVGGSSSAEVVSVTLLQGIKVLAVGSRSIMSEGKPEVTADTSSKHSRMVTFMVNTAQAEALQLAATQGKLTVAMRNPLDQEKERISGTRMSELSKDLAERIRKLAESETGSMPLDVPDMPKVADSSARTAASAPAPKASAAANGSSPAPIANAEPKPNPVWITTILRGTKKEVQKFELIPTEEPH